MCFGVRWAKNKVITIISADSSQILKPVRLLALTSSPIIEGVINFRIAQSFGKREPLRR